MLKIANCINTISQLQNTPTENCVELDWCPDREKVNILHHTFNQGKDF
jgi:hypothetical protein